VLLAVVLGMCASTMPSYSLGVFIAPLASDFGWTTTEITGWSLSWSIGCILAAPLVGFVSDRIGARIVALASLGLLLSVLLMTSFMPGGLWLFFATGFATGLASAGASSITYGRIITGWFSRGLGTALGLMSCGIGISAVFGPRLMQFVIDGYGWRWGYRVLACLPLLIFPWSFWFLAGGKAQSGRTESNDPADGLTMRAAIRTTAFWMLAVGTFFYGVCVGGVAVNLVPYLTSAQLSRPSAAAAAGLFGAATIVGRFGIGMLIDRAFMHAALMMCILFVSEGAAFLTIGLVGTHLLTLSLFVFGFSVGGEGSCLVYCVARIFGRRAFSSIFGFIGIMMLYLGTGIAPAIFSETRTVLHSYSTTFLWWAGLAFITAPIFAAVARTRFFGDSDALGAPVPARTGS
jgi:MFS family permease